MKKIVKALVVAGVLGASTMTMAPSADAYPRSGVSLYFNTGNVAVGYRDGYYDRYHHWRHWRRASDRDYYWRHYRHRYYDWNRGYHRGYEHSRYYDRGW